VKSEHSEHGVRERRAVVIFSQARKAKVFSAIFRSELNEGEEKGEGLGVRLEKSITSGDSDI
jgi:hypothetical protein